MTGPGVAKIKDSKRMKVENDTRIYKRLLNMIRLIGK